MEAFGIDDEIPERSESVHQVVDILPENRETVSWFLRMQRRWVTAADGRLARLDEAALLAMMNIAWVPQRKRLRILAGLMAMESSVLEFLSEKSGD